MFVPGSRCGGLGTSAPGTFEESLLRAATRAGTPLGWTLAHGHDDAMSEPLFDQQNAGYVQLLYEEFSRNPDSVPQVWREFFSRGPRVASEAGLLVPDAMVQDEIPGDLPGAPPASATSPGPSSPPGTVLPDQGPGTPLQVSASPLRLEQECGRDRLALVARSAYLVRSFRSHGHQMARLDPLGSEPPSHPELEPSFFGTTLEELEQVPASIIEPDWGDEPLAQVLARLEGAYCASIGYEFEHLEDPEKVRWLWEQVESGVHSQPLEREEKRQLLERLSEVEGFEHFLHRAYLGQKRFSLEGLDMMVPMLDEAIRLAAKAGCREVIMGMAHRGRLNVLVHLLGVSYREIIRVFEGTPLRKTVLSVPRGGTGDVKYHYGADGSFTAPDGSRVRVSLAPNPSHLEFVNPVVEGIARARQFAGPNREQRQEWDAVVPIVIHGDAAFAAEGIVAETLNLARLPGYTTGGTLHIITNNQVGFTTEPREGRSTRYASDLAKGYDIPVMHVNADDPEGCLTVVRLAMAYRARYHDDVVIDLVGYRRHGHNEGDEPAYTQPRQYRRIQSHPTVRTIWADRLMQEGVVTSKEAEGLKDRVAAGIREAQDQVRAEAGEPYEEEWEEAHDPPSGEVVTQVPLEDLIRLNDAALSYPEGFKVHPKLARQLQRRREGFGPEATLEWAHAETLAFASLLEDGVPVRLSGQDSGRGTFSQRHLILHHGETGERYVPLQHIGTARFEVYNSPLTEMALLGFEYGYAVAADPDLVLWEAQFGDFVNVAQVVIDQFISSGRAKWGQEARLTLLLPHGHEGQGPEHTSARLERFLQLCAEDNMRVAYPTTPAQYFHLLRRQALTPVVRPLVVMTPKSLLRHPKATSTLTELAEGSFRPVLGDTSAARHPEDIKRLVLCSGKIYYDIQAHPARGSRAEVAVARIEEMHPFPGEDLRELVGSFPNLREVVWAQEEPTNMGGLLFMGPRLRAVVPRTIPLKPMARPERASPAEGSTRDHLKAQQKIVEGALGVGEG
jgi:2-oxoglutarate dehydrogenase E1 component